MAELAVNRWQANRVRVFADLDELNVAAAAALAQLADEAVQQRGHFDLVLAGGSTPRRLYEHLAAAYAHRIPWPAVRLFWGDERGVPPDHPQSNYRLAWDTLINRVPIAAPNIHRMPGEVEPPAVAAAQYEHLLRHELRVGRNQFPCFDLVLLGLGEDGHTASLFPGSPALAVRRRWVVDVVAPPMYEIRARVTLTAPLLDHARAVFYLVTGEKKRTAVQTALARQLRRTLPTSRIRRPSITWFLDQPAARLLQADQYEFQPD